MAHRLGADMAFGRVAGHKPPHAAEDIDSDLADVTRETDTTGIDQRTAVRVVGKETAVQESGGWLDRTGTGASRPPST